MGIEPAPRAPGWEVVGAITARSRQASPPRALGWEAAPRLRRQREAGGSSPLAAPARDPHSIRDYFAEEEW